MRVRVLPVVAGIIAAAVAVSANQGQRPGGGGPTRVIVRAVANGQPVADLKAEDVSIRIDGRPREVKALELVTAGTGGGGAAAAPASTPAAAKVSTLPPPFATNVAAAAAATAPTGGREFLIILDEEGVAPGQEEPVRKAIAKIMSEAVEGDRFGYQSLRVGGKYIPPSSNRAAVTEEFAKFVGGGLSTENVVDITCRTKRSMGNLLNALTQAPAGRTLILITSGLVSNPAPVESIRSKVDAQGNINAIPETCQIRSNDLDDFGVAAAMSPANMYVIHFPQAMANMTHQQSGQTGIENLTGVSNAEFVRLTGGNETSLSRITRETTSYYIATLDEAPSAGMRRIDASVKRDGVKVIARPAAGRGRAPAMAASAKGLTPRDMIKVPASFAEVPLRAAGFVSRQGTSEMKLVTLFEVVDPSMKLTAASVAVIDDASGKATQWNAKPEELEKSPVFASQLVTPGKYRVRVAATTATGGGTVDYPLDATLTAAGPLKLSSMLIGTSSDRGFAPKMQFTPSDAMVVGVLELYGVPAGANVTAVFEILESENAPQPMGQAAGNVGKGSAEDVRQVFGGFEIKTLDPGDYLMRIKVSVDGKEVGAATRTFRKVTGS